MTYKMRQSLMKLGLYVCFSLIIIFFIFPIVWFLSLSFKSSEELYQVPPSLIPESFRLENYLFVIEHNQILLYLWNSAKIVVLTVFVVLLIAITSAFAVSRYHFKFKSFVFFTILFPHI